jgi:hypothetical protein
MRSKPRFKHPRTDGTPQLLSTTTELFIIDLIVQLAVLPSPLPKSLLERLHQLLARIANQSERCTAEYGGHVPVPTLQLPDAPGPV